MKEYFRIRFEPCRDAVLEALENRVEAGNPGFIAVCDGNILSMVQRDPEYREVIEGAMFSIMDSSWIPIYVKMKYGEKCKQYCGSDIFKDLTELKMYRQYFLGSSQVVLEGLKNKMSAVDENIVGMQFESLPFGSVDDFDYPGIAARINADAPDVIWLSLGAPKQEQFAARLVKHLNRGVVIPVGAVFNFRAGLGIKRAPQWMVKCHLEFVFRLFSEPRKQAVRCWRIITTLPIIFKKDGNSC